MCKVKEAPSPFDLADTRPASASSTSPRRHHIVTGTFNSTQLFVLEYDDLKSRLSILQEVDAEGPHQYLAMGRTNTGRSIVYATTWGQPAALSSWIVGTDEYHNHSQNDDASTTKSNDKYHLSFGNRALITATGSYVHVQPPSYHTFSAPGYGSMPGTGRWLGSAGGPTGELHRLDPSTGLIGEKVKELIFLSNPNELETADKSRKALRYGAHSFDCTSNSNSFIDDHHLGGGDHVHQGGQDQTAFVADLGSNSVKAYSFPQLEYLYEIPSGREHDGPRHSIPHPTLPLLFTVTEHTNYVDWFQLPSFASASSASFDKGSEMAAAKYLGSVDMLLPSQSAHRHDWRGDTLRLSTDARYLFATTRGKTEKQRGWLVVYKLVISEADNGQAGPQIDLQEVERFETRTSGGKANAIELAPPSLNSADSSSSHQQARDLLVLTDDEQGWIDVLEWNPTQEKLHVKATIQLPKLQDGDWQGASHAIWID